MAERIETVAVVGHGPSMLKNTFGGAIDDCDFVVRQKRSCMQYVKLYPQMYGTKAHAISGSFLIYRGLPDVKGAQYWIHVDSRLSTDERVAVAELSAIVDYFKDERKNLVIDRRLCDQWDEEYRRASANFYREKGLLAECKVARIQDEGHHYHPHTSSGFKAVIHAAHLLRPLEIKLFGFDALGSGEWTWSVTRGPSWQDYPNHAWHIEKELLKRVANEYDTSFTFIGSH